MKTSVIYQIIRVMKDGHTYAWMPYGTKEATIEQLKTMVEGKRLGMDENLEDICVKTYELHDDGHFYCIEWEFVFKQSKAKLREVGIID